MIVSHSLRAIFISNPKTGSKSIETALRQFQDEPILNEMSKTGFYTRCHMPAYALREALGASVWDSYFKFSFVRNPWDWFVSQHFYNTRKMSEAVNVNSLLSEEEIINGYDFLRSYRGAEWEESASQRAFVCDKEGRLLVDFLGRFENLHEDFVAIKSRLKCQAELPHVNSGVHRYYKDYYDDITAQLIRRLYQRDISLFSYNFLLKLTSRPAGA